MNKLQMAEQFRRAVQMFAASLSEDKALEIATIYDQYKVGKNYAKDEYFTWGVNSTGDPQLYKVNQAHTASAEWPPNASPALYTAIGLTDDGYPIWSQPSGAHDAYNKGDVVEYNGILYESLVDGNVYSPDAYPSGWKIYEGGVS